MARLPLRHRRTVLALIAVGVALRVLSAVSQPLWVDEAESAVNALTIHERGLPVDSYLGLPIYENTLTRPWPEHPEYEFKDSSYSHRGLAIYHGWLPLYSIAAALALTGIGPDDATDRAGWTRDLDALRWRTLAPRLPAVVFSILFLWCTFGAARELFGSGTAFAALCGAVASSSLVWMGAQARYYSATLALGMAALWCVARVRRHARWRDALMAAVVLVLLFHTHVLSFVIAVTVLTALAPDWLRRPGAWPKALAAGGVLLVGCVPWMLLTGWLDHMGEAPSAWPLLEPVAELRRYLGERVQLVALVGVGLACVLWGSWRGRAVARVRAERHALMLLGLWVVATLVLFAACMPAASFFLKRLSLPLLVPGVLLAGRGAWRLAGLVGRVSPRRRAQLASALLLLVLAWSGRLLPVLPMSDDLDVADFAPLEVLVDLELPDDARIYVTPNDQLVLAWYGGVPAQSIAPVRREFLEQAEHPVVLVERIHSLPRDADPLGWRGLQRSAASHGLVLDEDAARELARTLRARTAREDLRDRVARVEPPLRPLEPWLQGAVAAQREVNRRRHAEGTRASELPLILRDHEQRSWSDWWPIFFYRFVDPTARMGERLNYAGLLPRAVAHVDPGARWTVLVIPPNHRS